MKVCIIIFMVLVGFYNIDVYAMKSAVPLVSSALIRTHARHVVNDLLVQLECTPETSHYPEKKSYFSTLKKMFGIPSSRVNLQNVPEQVRDATLQQAYEEVLEKVAIGESAFDSDSSRIQHVQALGFIQMERESLRNKETEQMVFFVLLGAAAVIGGCVHYALSPADASKEAAKVIKDAGQAVVRSIAIAGSAAAEEVKLAVAQSFKKQ